MPSDNNLLCFLELAVLTRPPPSRFSFSLLFFFFFKIFFYIFIFSNKLYLVVGKRKESNNNVRILFIDLLVLNLISFCVIFEVISFELRD